MAGSFQRTAALHRLVAERTTIPMPETIAVDTSLQGWPWRYFIRTAIAGQEWFTLRTALSQPELAEAYREIGSATAQLHSIVFPGFGSLTDEAGISAINNSAQSYLDALHAHARRIIRSPRLQEVFSRLLDRDAALFADVKVSSLSHEDLHGHNILMKQVDRHWRLATILDF